MTDIIASGRVVAPGALAALATTAVPPAGRYTIKLDANVGNNAAADTDNMQLLFNGVVKENPIVHGLNGLNAETVLNDQVLDGINAVIVQAVGAGTAAIPYEAVITLTRTG